MAKFNVTSVEPRADAKLACDTFVLIEHEVDDGEGGIVSRDKVVGHFTVILNAKAVNAITGTKAQRVAAYKAMFAADPRIAGITDSELAVAKMTADVEFPVHVSL